MKRIWITALSVVAVSGMSLYVYAQQGQQQRQGQQGQQGRQGQQGQASGELLSTDDLIGTEVKTLQGMQKGQQGQQGRQGSQQSQQMGQTGESLGEVEEIVFDDENDAVYCVVVEADGAHYPVPWQAFDEQYMKRPSGQRGQRAAGRQQEEGWGMGMGEQESKLRLSISPDQFKQAPSMDSVDIAQLGDPSLKQRVCDFWKQHGMKGERAKQAMGGQQGQQGQQQQGQQRQQYGKGMQANLFKATEILGDDVVNYQDEEFAEINDFIIDAQHGSLAYALVSYGGVLGIGDELAAVPWSAFTLMQEEEYAMLDATEEQLQSARIEEGNLDRLSDRQFSRQIHQTFEAEPYWVVFAFIPASPEESVKAWQPDSEYNKNFKKDSMTTVEGKITNIGAFRPTENAAQGLRLKIKTKEDKTQVVYAGPRQWAMQQDVDWKAGKQATVKGSKTQVDGKQVIIASEITVEGKTVRLRDNEGKPQWNTEDLKRSMQQQQGQQGQQQQR